MRRGRERGREVIKAPSSEGESAARIGAWEEEDDRGGERENRGSEVASRE